MERSIENINGESNHLLLWTKNLDQNLPIPFTFVLLQCTG